MTHTIIFDIDGTLANIEHRLHHIEMRNGTPVEIGPGKTKGILRGWAGEHHAEVELEDGKLYHVAKTALRFRKNWEAFYGACSNDKPIEQIWALLGMAKFAGFKVVFVTGRSEKYREQTLRWLCKYWLDLRLEKVDLRMRRDGDHRPDYEIKRELVPDAELTDILFVVEDRSQVVKMWRERGLMVLQCADGYY